MNTIADYEIVEELHQSSNSLIYRAQKEGQAVILKVLREEYPDPERLAWFRREYELTRQLDLEGVVDVYGFFREDRWLMVLEDFGGESLLRLGLAGKLALADFLSLAYTISQILGDIHRSHIIHKDINPSNILLNPASGQVKIIDFGISAVLSLENPTFRNANLLEGTLPYISPEQTGRMNRALDYRTDFYSLGVTFYELLTGQLPFKTTDTLELLHSHIALQPQAPHAINPLIPQALSDIVMKLLAKTAEERYQSAWGIAADLSECLDQLESQAEIRPFPLARLDISAKFQIPQKLYGREEEINRLLAAFERVTRGKSEMMLVAGYPGIGKSALVQEIYKPMTASRGYFISGKFDQFQRTIPYSAIVAAFSDLVHQLLTESEALLGAWRERLLAALGTNGQVMIEVLPELELIIGPQPDIAELAPTEAQNRFNIVFQNFIRLFCRPPSVPGPPSVPPNSGGEGRGKGKGRSKAARWFFS